MTRFKNHLSLVSKLDGVQSFIVPLSTCKDFCKYYKLDNEKKIALLSPHAMSDNLFKYEFEGGRHLDRVLKILQK